MIGKMELELDGTKQQGSVRSGVTIRLNKHVTDMLENSTSSPMSIPKNIIEVFRGHLEGKGSGMLYSLC